MINIDSKVISFSKLKVLKKKKRKTQLFAYTLQSYKK